MGDTLKKAEEFREDDEYRRRELCGHCSGAEDVVYMPARRMSLCRHCRRLYELEMTDTRPTDAPACSCVGPVKLNDAAGLVRWAGQLPHNRRLQQAFRCRKCHGLTWSVVPVVMNPKGEGGDQ